MRSPIASHIQKAIVDNMPSILSGVAVAGLIGTVILAVKATPEAQQAIAIAEENKSGELFLAASDEEREDPSLSGYLRVQSKLTKMETIQTTWRLYIPAGLCGIATISCIIGSNALGMRRNAALLGAYALVDSNFREYVDKVREHVTEQKARKIDDEIMEAKIKRDPPKEGTVIVTGGGDQLCYESLTGRYFRSSAEKIRRAAQDIDARILQGDLYASLNEFFGELGLDSTSMGELMGFNIECRLKVVFSSHITECDQPALAIGYDKLPVYNYDTL
jgi:Family of unknown function (DUF6353)